VIWADELKDGTPFIVFEYVEGQDVEHLINRTALTGTSSTDCPTNASGLAHLHQQGSTTKTSSPQPTFTPMVVRCGFNIAVSDRDEETVVLVPVVACFDFKPTLLVQLTKLTRSLCSRHLPLRVHHGSLLMNPILRWVTTEILEIEVGI